MAKTSIVGVGLILASAIAFSALYSTAATQQLPTNVTVKDIDPYNLTINSVWFSGLLKPSDYTPSAGANYTVNCSITVHDDNGYQDINTVWASWFKGTDPSACDSLAEQDSDVCYRNSSCTAISGTGSGSERKYHCNFIVKYYADYGNWSLSVSANDSDGGLNATNTTIRTINILKSITTGSSINFGSMTAGELTAASVQLDINNTGNSDLSLTVQADRDMRCSVRGVVPVGNIRYVGDLDGGSGTAYGSACGILSRNDSWGCQALTVYDEEDPTTAYHIQPIYWAINVTEGVAGTCSNTITFTAN